MAYLLPVRGPPICVSGLLSGLELPCSFLFLQTPAESPTVQLNSDTVYPELASLLTGQGLGPTRLPPLWMPVGVGGLQLTPHLCTTWL